MLTIARFICNWMCKGKDEAWDESGFSVHKVNVACSQNDQNFVKYNIELYHDFGCKFGL